MDRRLAVSAGVGLLGVVICVLASLAVVWWLSETVGFRFMPTLVAATSGSISAAWLAFRLWPSRT